MTLTYSWAQSKIEYRSDRVTEVSGIDTFSNCDSLLFAINDSGNANEIQVLDYNGNIRQSIGLPRQFKNRDWEDMTAASIGDDRGFLLVGDIGNNKFFKKDYKAYLVYVTLPTPDRNYVQLDSIRTLSFSMDKNSYDAETLFYDTSTDNLYIVTKWGDFSKVFELENISSLGPERVKAKLVGTLPIAIATGGDLSEDSQHLLIRTYIDVFYWKRKPGESIGEMCSRTPNAILPYESEPQGEAIMWGPNHQSYYTMSEMKDRKHTFLVKYKFK